jgi:hypothetical protein
LIFYMSLKPPNMNEILYDDEDEMADVDTPDIDDLILPNTPPDNEIITPPDNGLDNDPDNRLEDLAISLADSDEKPKSISLSQSKAPKNKYKPMNEILAELDVEDDGSVKQTTSTSPSQTKLFKTLFKDINKYISKNKTDQAQNGNPIIEPSASKFSFLFGTFQLDKPKPQNMYEYCREETVNKILEYIDIANCSEDISKKNTECCVCMEEFNTEKLPIILTCKHPICKLCYDKIDDRRCPLCRRKMESIQLSKKYAIICLGKTTKRYMFDNGGYESMQVVYFPPFDRHEQQTYTGITYHGSNDKRYEFLQQMRKVDKAGYVFVYQDHKKVKKWVHEMEMLFMKECTPVLS